MTITINDSERDWLLLLFGLPAKSAQARVQAWRRLQRVGAVALKNSAYVLPHTPECREDFEWIQKEIVAAGGQSMMLVARAPDRATVDEIVSTFRSASGRDFHALTVAASGLLKRTTQRSGGTSHRAFTQQLRRLREQFENTAQRDFFGAPERQAIERLLVQLDQRSGRRPMMATASPTTAHYHRKVWLTRPRPGVDRMSSAWLIRRFVDPAATFVFDDPASTPNAIPFDTFKAEFGHHGNHCTFETLSDRFAIGDPAVRHIGRIVHDLDLKDTAYHEPETTTIGRLVEGLRCTHQDDELLLRAGIEMFEALYQSLAMKRVVKPTRQRKRSTRDSGKRAARAAKRS